MIERERDVTYGISQMGIVSSPFPRNAEGGISMTKAGHLVDAFCLRSII